MDREWKIGEDLSVNDNLLDEITFNELILTVHCNSRVITKEEVIKQLNIILSQRKEDMLYLLENNINEIIEIAKEGRS